MSLKAFRVIVVLLASAAAFLAGYGYGRWWAKPAAGGIKTKAGKKILYYIDPMHPAYKSDKPGIAPDCGMKLEPVYEEEAGAAPAAERKVLYYRDPQDPSYTSDRPGINPATGNDLEPVYADEPSTLPPGTVKISPEKQQLIGVRYARVERTAGVRTIRAVGKVAFDETRLARIHPRVEGWVEEVFVDFVGKEVQRGQPLLTLYSPELLATQQEYLLALKARDLMANSSLPRAIEGGASLAAVARKRLQLWELSDSQIDEIARTGRPLTFVTLYAPISGYVIARNAFPKQRVSPELELYTLADLSKVWIFADVFEYEAPLVRLGLPATVRLAYYPGRTLRARVNYIQPQVDSMTRTLKVRLEAENPDLLLKPDMFVDVEFQVQLPSRLTVPSDAVLDSGVRRTVFVARGNGLFEPREVEVGERLEDRTEILRGLREGELVVVSGNFLIDSESQLKAAAAGMTAGPHAGHGQQPTPGTAPKGEAGPAPQATAPHQGHVHD